MCLLVGLVLRWVNLGEKVFWYDEVFTALRVTGHLDDEVRTQVFTGIPLRASDLLQYQTFAPDSRFIDTLRSLVDHPEHPPLFYLLCWGWVKLFGPSIAAFRGVSALASALTFLALPLLAWELFAIAEAAVIAPLLFAFSPVHLLYAQEARQYALWTLVVVLATWALRRAVRLGRWRAWGFYGLLLGLTFYTTVLSLLVVAAHGVYALGVLPRRQWPRAIAAIALATILFSPWLGVMLVYQQRWQEATSWTTAIAFPFGALVKLWGLHFTAIFVDPNLPLDHPYSWIGPLLFLAALTMLLISLWKVLPKESSLLLLSLILVPAAMLIGGDLVRGSILSKNTRYFMPSLIGVLVAVAGWSGLQYRRHRQSTTVGLALVVGLCAANAIALIQAPTWWNKSISYHNRDIGAAIGRANSPVLLMQVGDLTLGDALSLSYYVPADTSFVISRPPDVPQPPPAAQTVFLFQPSEQLANSFDCLPVQAPVEGGLFQVPCLPPQTVGKKR